MKKKATLALLLALLFISSEKIFAEGTPCYTTLDVACAGATVQEEDAVATTLDAETNTEHTIEDTVLKWVGDGLIAVAQQQAANDILSWANGGFNGSDPLIITNPENYFKKKTLDQVKRNIAYIPVDSVYGDSIFKTLVDTNKDVSMATKLKSLSSSNVPSLIQKNVCGESYLTELATEEASAEEDGIGDGGDAPSEGGEGSSGEGNSPTQEAIQAKYDELYNKLCTGDPNRDPATAKTLTTLATQRPSAGGWDTWLATTGGDNAYTQTQKAVEEQAKQNAKKDKIEETKFIANQGIASQTECNDPVASSDSTGDSEAGGEGGADPEDLDPYSGDVGGAEAKNCVDENIKNPGIIVKDNLSKASTAALDRLTILQGNGALSSILTGFAASFLMKGLNTAFTSSKINNNPVSLPTSGPLTPDLKNDPERKAALISPILKQIDLMLDALTSLEQTNVDYLLLADNYKSDLDSMKQCFINLGPPQEDDRILKVYSYYDERIGRINKIKDTITSEKQIIPKARTFGSTTKTNLQNSSSTQEISNIFDSYNKELEDKKYPSGKEARKKASEYRQSQSQTTLDRKENIERNLTLCNNIKMERVGR